MILFKFLYSIIYSQWSSNLEFYTILGKLTKLILECLPIITRAGFLMPLKIAKMLLKNAKMTQKTQKMSFNFFIIA